MMMSAPSRTASVKPLTSVPWVTWLSIPSLLTMASTDAENPLMMPRPDVMGTTATLNPERSVSSGRPAASSAMPLTVFPAACISLVSRSILSSGTSLIMSGVSLVIISHPERRR